MEAITTNSSHAAKNLSQETIDAIRNTPGSNRQLAAKFGLSPSTISLYRNGIYGTPSLRVDAAPVGIFDLSPGMSFQEWTGKFELAVNVHLKSSWFLAEVLNHPQADTDAGIQLIEDVHTRMGGRLAKQTLLNLKSIGACFPPGVRREGLSFSHHQLLGPLMRRDLKGCLALMDRAEKEEWSTRELQAAIKERGGDANRTPDADVGGSGLSNLRRHLTDALGCIHDPSATTVDRLTKFRLTRDALNEYLGEADEAQPE